MFCGNCGQSVPDGARFCSKCGASLTPPPPADVPPAPAGVPEPPAAGTGSATEFFGSILTGQDDGAPEPGPAPEQVPAQEEEADAPEESATAFFGAPPVSGVQPPPELDGEAGFDPDASATEFFSSPPVGGDGAPGAQPPAGPILTAGFQLQTQGGAGGGPGTPPKATIIGGRKSRIGLFAGLGAAAVALIVLVVFLVRFIAGMGGGKQPILYLSGDELMYLPKIGAEPIELADDADDGAAVAVSENGKYAYFILSGSSDRVLYRAELGRLRAGSDKNEDYIVKVDSRVGPANGGFSTGTLSSLSSNSQFSAFYLTGDGETAFYLKQDDTARLRRFDGKESETLEKDVASFQVSSDETYLLISKNTPDGTALIRRGTAADAESETVVRDYESLHGYNSDFSVLKYTVRDPDEAGDDALSAYIYGKDGSEKIVSRVSRILTISGKDDYAFLRSSDQDLSLSAFVEDDMAAQDAGMREPSYEDFQTIEQYEDYWGDLRERTVTDYDAYYEARDRYYEKEQRDRLRQALEEETYTSGLQSLYVHAGGKDTLICDRVVAGSVHNTGDGVYLYSRYEEQSDVKLKLSEISDTWDVYDALEQEGMARTAIADASGEKAVFEFEFSTSVFTGDNTLYAIESEDATLVSYTAKGTYADRRQIAQDVQDVYVLYGSDKVYFTVDAGGGSFDLYTLNKGEKVKVASDVDASQVMIYEDGALAALGRQRDYDRPHSELTYYTASGDKRTYGEDVHGCRRLEGDRFLVLADYSGRYGTLYLFGGKEKEKVADDVNSFAAFGGDNPSYYIYNG